MKKILAVLTCIVLLLTAVNVPKLGVKAEESNVVSGTYGNSDGGNNVQWSLNKTTGKLTISGSGQMKVFRDTAPEPPWYEYRDSIKDVEMSDEITYITERAFIGLKLDSLKIPANAIITDNVFNSDSSVKKLILSGSGNMYSAYSRNNISPFYYLRSKVEELIISDGITSIDEYSFESFSKLSKLTIADSVTKIKTGAFANTSGTAQVTLPYNLTTIKQSAFKSSTLDFGNLAIPNATTEIGQYAFYGCTNLTSVSFGSGNLSIGEYAFYNHSNLTGKIIIPETVQSIGACNFGKCDGITEIEVPVKFIGSRIFNEDTQIVKVTITGSGDMADSSSTPWESSKDTLEEVVINDGVTSIGNRAFREFSNLKRITLPDSITRIGDSAFYQCNNLQIDAFPSNLSKVGEFAFQECNKIDCSLVMSQREVRIGEQAFSRVNISDITIKGEIVEISRNAFGDNYNLKSISIESGIETIGMFAFSDDTNVETVYLPHTLSHIENYAFENVGSNKDVQFSFEDGYNYKFYSDAACENEIETDFTTCATADGSPEIYIKATPIPSYYTIKFDGNEADSGTVASISDCLYSSEVTLPDNEFIKNGYEFIGWADTKEKADAGTVVYVNKAKVTKLVKEDGGSITLYAVWKPLEFTISYILNDEGASPADFSVEKTTYTCIEDTYVIKTPTRKWFSFDGWYKEGTFVSRLTEIKKGSVGDITLYAKWNSHTKDTHVSAKSPTCINTGNIEYWECSCGAKFSVDGDFVENVTIPANGHSFTNYVSNDNATCTVDGTKTGTCSVSGCNETDTIIDVGTKRGHSFINYIPNNDATCIADGTKTATCERTGCSETDTVIDDGSKIDHRFANYVSNKDATCTADGTKTAICVGTGCNETNTIIDEGTALGHDYVGVVTKEPTKTQTGIKKYVCSRCEDSYEETLEKLPDDGIPYIKDSYDQGFTKIKDAIENTPAGDKVTVVMNGATTVPADVFEAAKGKDITIIFDMGNGVSWTVRGTDITGTNLKDINLSITKGVDAGKNIPVDVINEVTGEKTSINISLAYDGEFGFKATLTVNLEAKNSGYIANLFYYNPTTKNLEYVCSSTIDVNGNVELLFSHASDYTIVISDKDMNPANNAVVTPGNKQAPATTAPSTGDQTPVVWMFILIMLSTAGMVVLKKKETK